MWFTSSDAMPEQLSVFSLGRIPTRGQIKTGERGNSQALALGLGGNPWGRKDLNKIASITLCQKLSSRSSFSLAQSCEGGAKHSKIACFLPHLFWNRLLASEARGELFIFTPHRFTFKKTHLFHDLRRGTNRGQSGLVIMVAINRIDMHPAIITSDQKVHRIGRLESHSLRHFPNEKMLPT